MAGTRRSAEKVAQRPQEIKSCCHEQWPRTQFAHLSLAVCELVGDTPGKKASRRGTSDVASPEERGRTRMHSFDKKHELRRQGGLDVRLARFRTVSLPHLPYPLSSLLSAARLLPPSYPSLSLPFSLSVSPPLCLSVFLCLSLPLSVCRLLALPPALDSS